jgi:hypothetical protein
VANRLADETSPYLLQHKDNPVDWYPWSDEALERARREDKPLLVSIGYSACHWCHVMEHESFEDPAVAALMNDLFVNIKIDREERPDLDSIYMSAVQAMTGHGGWPLNVFLTPEGVPFYGGTYFPPDDRMGMPSWPKVLEAVSGTFTTRREDVEESAAGIRDYLDRANGATPNPSPLRTEIFDQALAALHQSFDDRNGGFGGAPKFPQASAFLALLRIWRRSGDPRARTMLETTLDRMARGGIYDQVGGGFHRYAVDEIWLVPHFEKMLYDNAQLALVYLEAFQAFGDPRWARIAGETLDYVVREMTGPDGRFYATQDADSEGEEGKFYVWTPEELAEVLGVERAAPSAPTMGCGRAATSRAIRSSTSSAKATATRPRSGWTRRRSTRLGSSSTTSEPAASGRARRQSDCGLERDDVARVRPRLARPGPARLPRRCRAERRIPPVRNAARRQAAALDQGRRRQDRRLPGGLRQRRRRPARAARGDTRRAVAARGARPRRDDGRRVRRSGGGGILRHGLPAPSRSSPARAISRTGRPRPATASPPTCCCGSGR